MIAALTTARPDKYQVIELLISFGADIQQRGINGFTPLHCAAADNDAKAIELLLSHGAYFYGWWWIADPTLSVDDVIWGSSFILKKQRREVVHWISIVPRYQCWDCLHVH